MLLDLFADYLGWIIALIIIGMTILLVMAFMYDSTKYNKLMTQCLADGKKEYECYSLLKQDYVPVVIPVLTGR